VSEAGEKICPKCKEVNEISANHCIHCGAPLPVNAQNGQPPPDGGQQSSSQTGEGVSNAGEAEGKKGSPSTGEGNKQETKGGGLGTSGQEGTKEGTNTGEQPGTGKGSTAGHKINVQSPEGDGTISNTGDNTQINQNNIQNQTVNIYERREEEKISLNAVAPAIWKKVQSVFVKPAAYTHHPFPRILDTPADVRQERVFIVQGREHTGTTFCAIHLGWELLGKPSVPSIFSFRRNRQETLALVDFVQRSQLAKGSVFLVDLAFENGVALDELSQLYLPNIQARLMQDGSYLILTTNDEAIPQKLSVPVLHTDDKVPYEELTNSVQSHLKWYGENAGSINLAPERLEVISRCLEIFEGFAHPYQVNKFFVDLGKANFDALMVETLEPGQSLADLARLEEKDRRVKEKETLQRFAGLVLHPVGISPHAWFKDLSRNDQLFAMLVGLFENVERSRLDELFKLAVEKFRKDGLENFADTRNYGRNDQLEAIHAIEKENHLVYFENTALLNEVRQQFENWHEMLWELVEMWGEIIGLFQDFAKWEMRRSFGTAIGWLGANHPNQLRDVLDALAHTETGTEETVSSYALEQLCIMGPQNFPLVKQILETWVNSGHPAEHVTAAAAIWRIYGRVACLDSANSASRLDLRQDVPGGKCTELWKILHSMGEKSRVFDLNKPIVKRILIDGLKEIQFKGLKEEYPNIPVENLTGWETGNFPTKIAEKILDGLDRWVKANCNALIPSLLQIANSYPEDVVYNIKQWVEPQSERTSIPETKSLSYIALSTALTLFDRSNRLDVSLIEERHMPLLGLVEPLLRYAPEQTNHILNTLIRWLNQPGWPPKIHLALMRNFNRLTSESTSSVRYGLAKYWLDGDNAEARKIGRALLVRLCAMDGSPMDLTGHGSSVVIVDVSTKGRPYNAVLGHLAAMAAESRLDGYVFCMGDSHPLVTPGRELHSRQLRSLYDHPRLIRPQLGSGAIKNPKQVRSLTVLTWDTVLDLGDLEEQTFTQNLLLVSPEPPGEKGLKPAAYFLPSRNEETDFQALEANLERIIGRHASRQEAAEWQALLSARFNGPLAEPGRALSLLEKWAGRLDEMESSQSPDDLARNMMVLGLWLSKVDLPRLKDWVFEGLDKSGRDTPRYHASRALAKLLFKLQAAADPPASLEATCRLLDLIEPLTRERRDWGNVRCILDAIQRWLPDPAWMHVLFGWEDAQIASRPFQRKDWLSLLVQNTPQDQLEKLQGLIREWQLDSQPEAVRQAADLLASRLVLGESNQFPPLESGRQYALILLDASQNRDVELAQLVELIAKRMSENEGLKDKYTTVICRLGQRNPIKMTGKLPEFSELFPEATHFLPALAGRQLAQVEPEQVGLILSVTNSTIIDQEDWDDRWYYTPFLACSKAETIPPLPPYAKVIPWNESAAKTAGDIISYMTDFMRG
jgi:hypothetical protein